VSASSLLLILAGSLAFVLSVPLSAQVQYIRLIEYDLRDVFDNSEQQAGLIGNVANALHAQTRPFVIDDELLFAEGDELDETRILETERNLRRTGLFSAVAIRIRAVTDDSVDVIVMAQDRFSLRPALLFGTGGGISNYGAKIEEVNLFGIGTQVLLSGLYRTENQIGWEGLATVGQRRLFRSEIGVYGSILANRVRTDQTFVLDKPYRTMATPWAGRMSVWNSFGSDFNYLIPDIRGGLPFEQRGFSGWWSTARGETDRLFFSVNAHLDHTERALPQSQQGFDNTVRLLVSFGSIRQDFRTDQYLNGYETEDIQTGGWGSVTIGRILSTAVNGEDMWYVSGRGEQSDDISKSIYLFGSVAGGSGFARSGPRFTGLDVMGLGHIRLSPNVVLTSRIRAEIVWNWQAFHQLVLDNDADLRGYPANAVSGDNRIVANTEVRWFPRWQVMMFGFSGALFHDFGSAWNQGVDLSATQWRHTVGLGIRVHNVKASGADAIFRIDAAFRLDTMQWAGLIFTTDQLFSAFGSHRFRPSEIVNINIDQQ